MKRTLIVIMLLINWVGQLCAIEPARTVTLALPGIFRFSDFENYSTYNLEKDLSENEAFMLTIPQQVLNSNIELRDAFSWKLPAFAYDVYNIYSSRSNFKFLSGDGTMNISRLLDMKNGELKIHIRYNNISLSCSWDDEVHDLSLAGDVDINFSFFTESIAILKITISKGAITGEAKDLNGTVEIVFNSKEDAFSEYYSRNDWETRQKEAISLLKGLDLISWESVDLSSSSPDEDFIRFAQSNKALDLLDCLTVYCIENENEFTNIINAFSQIIDPIMYVNGEIEEDIKLSSAIDVFNFVMNLIF